MKKSQLVSIIAEQLKDAAKAPAVPTDVTNLAKAQGAATGVAI